MCISLFLSIAAVVLDFFFIRCHIYKLNMTDVKSNHHFSIRAHFSIMIILSISTVHIFAFLLLFKQACTAQYEFSRLLRIFMGSFSCYTDKFINHHKRKNWQILKKIVHCEQNYQINTLLSQHTLFFYFHY